MFYHPCNTTVLLTTNRSIVAVQSSADCSRPVVTVGDLPPCYLLARLNGIIICGFENARTSYAGVGTLLHHKTLFYQTSGKTLSASWH